MRQLGTGLATSTVAIVVVCSPTLPLLLDQLRNKNGPGLATPTATFFPVGVLDNLGSAIAGYHYSNAIVSIIAIWPLGVVIGLTLLGRLRLRSNLQLLAMIAVPAVVLLVTSGLGPRPAASSRSDISSRLFPPSTLS